MTRKRFYLNEGEVGILKILDLKENNEAIYHTASKSDMKMIVELFNRLSEENEQLNYENKQLQLKLEQYERIMSDFDVSSFGELRTIMEQGCGV